MDVGGMEGLGEAFGAPHSHSIGLGLGVSELYLQYHQLGWRCHSNNDGLRQFLIGKIQL